MAYDNEYNLYYHMLHVFVPGQERSPADESMIYILYMYDLLLVFVYERNSELVGHYAFVQI